MENEPTVTQLSPAAQAVLTTYEKVWGQGYGSPLAAALRAVAERNEYKPDMRDEMEVMFSEGWNGLRKELLEIADELEAA